MRRLAFFLLVGFSVVCFAQDDGDDAASSSLVLDADTMAAVEDLAVRMAGVNATQATVDDNVEAILALLQSLSMGATGYKSFRTLPYGQNNGTITLGQILGLYFEGTSTIPNATSTNARRGYFYQIQRALYGRSGIPSADDAVIPLLLRLEDGSVGLTNLIERMRGDVLAIRGICETNLVEALERIDTPLTMIQSALYDFQNDFDGQFTSLLDSLDDYQAELLSLHISLTNSLPQLAEDVSFLRNNLPDSVSSIADNTSSISLDTSELVDLVSSLPVDIVAALSQYLAAASLNVQVDWAALPDPVFVRDRNWDAFLPVVTNLDDSVKGILAGSNYLTNRFENLYTNMVGWKVRAHEFYERMQPSGEDIANAFGATNDVSVSLADDEREYTDDLQTMTNDLASVDYESRITSDDDQSASSNPWDGATAVGDNLSSSASSLFTVQDPSFTTEVVLFGTESMPVGLPSIPRIAFDVDDLFRKSQALSLIKSIMSSLWLVVGLVLKLYLVRNYLRWQAEHNKR